ncbi:hypothetical protein EV363DRAFT_1261858, partial [Boletus edulis]
MSHFAYSSLGFINYIFFSGFWNNRSYTMTCGRQTQHTVNKPHHSEAELVSHANLSRQCSFPGKVQSWRRMVQGPPCTSPEVLFVWHRGRSGFFRGSSPKAKKDHQGQDSQARDRDPNLEDEHTAAALWEEGLGSTDAIEVSGHIEMGVKRQETSGESMRKIGRAVPSSDQGELVWSVVCLNGCAYVVEGMLNPRVSSDSFVVNFLTET